MSRRDLLIPPLTDTDGQPVSVTIGVSLVDVNHAPVIGYTLSEGVIEPFTQAADEDGTTLALVPQSEIYGECYYQIHLVSAHRRATHYVQIPDGIAPIALQDLLSLGDPVTPAAYDRLLPDPAALDDGLWLTTDGGAWAVTDATPSGIPDAPLTAGPYGRQGGAWVAVANPVTLIAATTLSGHRVIAADAQGRAIYAEATDATAQAVVGISTQAAVADDQLILATQGALDWPAGGLTPDAPLFLSTAGTLTHSAPVLGWLRQIAVAVAADRLVIDIGPAYWLGHMNP